MKWHEDYGNVTALGRYLVEEMCFDAEELQAYYEKPWKWHDEYEDMLAAREGK